MELLIFEYKSRYPDENRACYKFILYFTEVGEQVLTKWETPTHTIKFEDALGK